MDREKQLRDLSFRAGEAQGLLGLRAAARAKLPPALQTGPGQGRAAPPPAPGERPPLSEDVDAAQGTEGTAARRAGLRLPCVTGASWDLSQPQAWQSRWFPG